MRTTLLTGLCLVLLDTAPFAAELDERPQFLQDRLVIKFSSPVSAGLLRGTTASFVLPGRCNAILAAAGAQEVRQLFPIHEAAFRKSLLSDELSSIYEIRFGRDINVAKLINVLRSETGVAYAEPRRLRYLTYTPNDPALAQGLQNYLTLVRAREAWDLSRGNSGVIVAIVDTGVDWNHEDLAANIWSNPGEVPNNANDDDHNGFVDDVRGWDFGGLSGTPDNDPREDRADHGTHVAGIAAAVSDNGKGVSGIAFHCTIMPVKTSQDDIRNGNDALIAYGYEGIVYAADNGASVINCSWGGPGYSQFEQDVINYATRHGALVVAAAGNSAASEEFYPAAYDHALAVASINGAEVRSTFSNYGNWVDVSSPGEALYSTWQSAAEPYTYLSGTSMASPVVAGVCALVKSQHPEWLPEQVGQQVRVSAENIDALNSRYARQIGFGRVDAYSALTASSPAVRWVRLNVVETTGNQNAIIEPGETIGLLFDVTNYLQNASNVSLNASTADPYASILSPARSLGTLAGGDTLTAAQPVLFRVADNTPSNHRLDFLLTTTATGYSDYQPFHLVVRPALADVQGGNVAATISSFGALGFYDYADTGENVGLGFQFPAGSSSALFHGGFLLATGANHVSDVAYGRADGITASNPRYDFATASGGDIKSRIPTISSSELISRFDDSVAESPIGVEVTQTALTWNDPPNDDFVVLQYAIRNTKAAAITNLYAGYYLDWDIINSGANFINWDSDHQLGYMYASNSNYYGICAVSPDLATSYRAINNPNDVWNGFLDGRKFDFFIGGFTDVAGTSPDDWSQQLGVGPFTLGPNETTTVAFAILGGTSLTDLRTNAEAARSVYSPVGVEEAPAPFRFELAQNQPNPFALSSRGQTRIAYSLARDANVRVKIFNLLGQEVATLREDRQAAGRYAVSWSGRDLQGTLVPSGIYFYQVLADNQRLVRRMVVLR